MSAAHPTGVVEDEIVSMSVAVHLSTTNIMDYNYKAFEKKNWVYYKAWEVLKGHYYWKTKHYIYAAIRKALHFSGQ